MSDTVKYRIVLDLEYHISVDRNVSELAAEFRRNATDKGYKDVKVSAFRQDYKEIT